MTPFERLVKQLENKIQNAYTEGATMEQAEKLAGEFLGMQLTVSSELRNMDLSARMKKSGLKAIKAAVYTDACAKADKKPTESALEHLIAQDGHVGNAQDDLDKAEVERDELERIYNVMREAHVFFRGIAKGNYNG